VVSSLRIATRGSTLARWQAEHVADLLGTASGGDLRVELVIVETAGDRRQDVPLDQIGGRGIFVKEVQAAVLDGRADLAVHSAKDLPSSPELAPEGLAIVAVPERGDPRDVLVGSRLADLPPGALVATGSARRRALLADLRPDLTFVGLRGNIETRLAKAPSFAAIVMALAPLQRLGLEHHVGQVLEPHDMLPQVGQGALAIECRRGDDDVIAAVAVLDHGPSRRAVDAERGFLAALGGGCDLPVAAHATVAGDGALHVAGLLATFDGRQVLRVDTGAPADADAGAVGAALAGHLLDGGGGRWLLAEAGILPPG
jgi:hydroxymethylbilane synthase